MRSSNPYVVTYRQIKFTNKNTSTDCINHMHKMPTLHNWFVKNRFIPFPMHIRFAKILTNFELSQLPNIDYNDWDVWINTLWINNLTSSFVLFLARKKRIYLYQKASFQMHIAIFLASTCLMPCIYLYPLEISENQRFSDVSRGYRKRTVVWNGLNRMMKQ